MYNARNILFLAILILTLLGCKKEIKDVVKREIDPETTASVITRDVKTLISDSGVTKYRITSKLWKIFQEAKKPFWKFPYGLYIEQFDSVYAIEATIKCDSATYFRDDQIWRLDGHVTIENVKGELILTQQLFWNQRLRKVYSDSFIHIENNDKIIEGFGFVSNETMTTYDIQRVSGIFPIQEKDRAKRDTTDNSVITK